MDVEVVRPADHLLDKLHLELRNLMRKILITHEGIAVLSGTDQFLRTVSLSGKTTQSCNRFGTG